MEKFLAEIISYADATGRRPQSILRDAIGAGWGKWDSWVSGKSSPTLITADRLRAYMAANPPPVSETSEDAA